MVQTGERLASTASERYLLVYMILVLIIITSLVIVFFVVFQKRKNKLLQDRIKQQQAFEAEIIQAQTEAQEQTFIDNKIDTLQIHKYFLVRHADF